MSIQSPVGTLDIKNATLRVGKLEVSNIQGIDTALNVTRANSVLIYDDQASTTTFTGFTSTVGVRDTSGGYLDLAGGYVYWGQKLPNSWVMDFEMDIRSGTNAGPLYANVFSTTNTGGDGYSFTFNDSNDKISLYYDTTLLTETVVSGLFTAGEDWQKVVINYERGMIAISLDGTRKFYYKDIERETPYVNGEYINFSSASSDGRKIRKLRVVNGEKWVYTGDSNVVYSQGSVGIGVIDPTATLDVAGTVKALSFVGDGSQLGNIASNLEEIVTNGNVAAGVIQLINPDTGLVATGNIQANYFIGDGSQLDGISSTLQQITDNGNTTSNTIQFTNADVGLVATGNIEANYFIGDGSQLDGISSTLQQITDNGNTTSNTIQFTNADVGLVATGNIEANYFIGDGSQLDGISSTLQQITDNGNTTTNTIQFTNADVGLVATGNIEANYFIGDGTLLSNVVNDTELQSNITILRDTAITFQGVKTFQDDVILESNLRVNGSVLVANTINMTISDPIIELGSNNLNTGDIGLVMTRHGASNSNVAVFFDESADVLKIGYTLGGANNTTLEFDSNALAVNVQGAFTASTVSATTISGALSGNASTATKLQTARTINGTSFDGSANITITANTPQTLTRGTYLTGSNFNGGTATTWAVDATSAATASKVVARDANGSFSANVVTATLSGNASTATKLQTARTINGTSFDGSANITITANTPQTLTRGTYLTGSNFNGGTATTWAVDATNAATASKVVARDANGSFSANVVSATTVGTHYGAIAGSNTIAASTGTFSGLTVNGTQSMVYTAPSANGSYNGLYIDYNSTGTQTLTADRTHRALYIDMDSSSAGGDTANSHNMQGLYIDVQHTGDSDYVYGENIYMLSDHASGTTRELRGINSDIRSSGAGTNTNVYGIYNFVYKDGGSTATTSFMCGVSSEIQTDSTAAITTARVYQAIMDVNAGTTTTGVLYYGDFQGAATNEYGLYIQNETYNYFSGNVGIGVTNPGYKLHVNGTLNSGAITATSIYYPSYHVQHALSGGGDVTWANISSTYYLKWSDRVIAIPVEKTEMGASGYIDINCPTSGTITYFSGSGSTSTTATCTTNGIPMPIWSSLYYVVTPGQANTSAQANFRLIYHQNSGWVPNSNWILIATVNGDTSSQNALEWLPGRTKIPLGGTLSSTYGAVNATYANSAGKLATARTINGTSFDGSANITITANTPQTLTRGTYLTGSNFNGGTATTWAVDATTANTASKIVARDANGDIFGRYLNGSYVNMSHASATRSSDTIFYSSTDNYIRKTDATGFRASLNVPTRTGGNASGSWGISITGSAASAGSVTGKSSINKTAHTAGANDYHLELYSDNTGDGSKEVSLRFHQGSQYWGQIRFRSSQFYFTEGSSDTRYAVNTGSINATGDIYASGNVTAYSDLRKKKNLQIIEAPIEKVKKLNGYTYEMDEIRYTGLVAQEVLKVLPEAVVGDEEKGYALAYGNMAGLLVEVVKELNAKNESLKYQLDAVIARLDAVENSIS